MKINYHQQHKRKRSAARWVLVLLFVGALMIGFNTLPQMSNVPRIIYAQFATVISTFNGYNLPKHIALSKSELIEQNSVLQTKIQKLELRALHNKTLTTENKRLKDLFYNTPSNTAEHLARVIDYQDIPYGTLLARLEGGGVVPRGSMAHVGELALGEVAEASYGIVLIKLFTASDAAYDVTVPIAPHASTSTKTTLGNFLGRSNGSGRVTLSSEYTVPLGSIITLPIAGGKILGTVQSIDAPSDAALQTLLIRTTVPLRDLQFITITPAL